MLTVLLVSTAKPPLLKDPLDEEEKKFDFHKNLLSAADLSVVPEDPVHPEVVHLVPQRVPCSQKKCNRRHSFLCLRCPWEDDRKRLYFYGIGNPTPPLPTRDSLRLRAAS